MRRIAVLDAPSNLGLRPPTETSVPGCAKAPGALRDQGLLRRLDARDAGCLTPPRYDPADWRPGDGVCHAPEIALYSRRLADRIGAILDQGEFPVVLGGDCSIVLGSALAMHRLGEAVGGRIGLVFVDGHSDFRHPGNASYVGAAAGEDLALVTGRGQPDLASIEGRRPYYRDIDVVVMGIRAQDEYRLDLQAAGIITRPVPALRAEGAARSAQWAKEQLVDCAGYWVHLDVDVLDPAVMPAVDAPEPGGIAFPELELLLAGLVESPHCLGVEITVFDPDYDPDGRYAEEITEAIVAGLKSAHTVDARPDLVAARKDFLAPGVPGKLGTPPVSDSTPALASVVTAGEEAPEDEDEDEEEVGGEALGAALGEALAGAQPAQDGPSVVPDPVQQRRAAAAADGVALAAAGMSGGGPGATADGVAVPVTTLRAVEEAAEVEARIVEPAPVEEPPAEPAAEPAAVEAHVPQIAEVAAHGAEPGEGDGPGAEVAEIEAEVVEPAHGEPHLADPADGEPHVAEPVEVEARVVEPVEVEAHVVEPAVGTAGWDVEAEPEPPVAETEDPQSETDAETDEEHGERALRPLGQAPLLDSEPMPATMPGMLRPRPIEDFTLPVQRPAFEIGPEAPADVT